MKNEGWVRSQDADIYYRLTGQGKPMVMLHGNGESHKDLTEQIRYFKTMYQLILIDSRGHGNSSLGFQGLNFEIMAKDVAAVLNYLKIEQAIFLGFSDGANLAIQFAFTYPQYVRALIAVSGNLYPKGLKTRFYLSIYIPYIIWCLLGSFHWKARHKKSLYGLMVRYPHMNQENLAVITAPTLILAGETDMIKESHTKLIGEMIHDSQVVIIPKAGHMGFYKKPLSYNHVIKGFLENRLS